jgi:hypothetical protein
MISQAMILVDLLALAGFFGAIAFFERPGTAVAA